MFSFLKIETACLRYITLLLRVICDFQSLLATSLLDEDGSSLRFSSHHMECFWEIESGTRKLRFIGVSYFGFGAECDSKSLGLTSSVLSS